MVWHNSHKRKNAMRKRELYTLPQVAKIVGQSYNRVRYASCYKQVVVPLTYGGTKLFTPQQIDFLKEYFALTAKQQADYTKEVLEYNRGFGEGQTL
jgi:hypothetical protein